MSELHFVILIREVFVHIIPAHFRPSPSIFNRRLDRWLVQKHLRSRLPYLIDIVS